LPDLLSNQDAAIPRSGWHLNGAGCANADAYRTQQCRIARTAVIHHAQVYYFSMLATALVKLDGSHGNIISLDALFARDYVLLAHTHFFEK
jgi:hypothetical protein